LRRISKCVLPKPARGDLNRTMRPEFSALMDKASTSRSSSSACIESVETSGDWPKSSKALSKGFVVGGIDELAITKNVFSVKVANYSLKVIN
jgi:hypothetical protein